MIYKFNDVYRDYKRKVMGFIYKRVGNNGSADDIFNEIFINIHIGLDKFNKSEKQNINAWISTITRNCIIQHHRSNKRYKNYLNIDSDDNIVEIVDTSHDVVKQHSDVELKEIIKKLFIELDKAGERYTERKSLYRSFLCEKYFIDDLNLNEIAETYNINLGTVKSNIFTSRKLLQQMLIDEGITVESYCN